MRKLYLEHYNWSNKYAVHAWQRNKEMPIPQSEADADRLNSTMGEIARHVLYGSKALRSKAKPSIQQRH